ncbi:MAG: hypothetical protein D6718_06415 [Acidobacteria bacterium]|nr:MAG: hypothetical protein D6718_06415 [Acidobacteriota bacterium]
MTATSPAARLEEAIRSGTAPRPARLAAARGALPLEPGQLVALQVLLAGDPDGEIAAAARASLDALDADSARDLAEDPATPAHVLSFLAAEIARFDGCGPALARRADLPEDAALALARGTDAEALEALALNQELLARHRPVGDALRDNAALPAAARPKLLDYLDELGKRAGAGAAGAAERELRPAKDPFLAALGFDAEVEALLPTLDLDLGQLTERSELLGEVETEREANVIKRLSGLKIGQKIRVALFGNREERMVLIRDSNRTVATAVLKNPQFSEEEAEAVSNSRNVSQEVLRLVAQHREFARNYHIQHNLVKNPRTPIEIAQTLVSRLNDKDLKLLTKNRNVSDAVRRQAKRLLEAREARRRVRVRRSR